MPRLWKEDYRARMPCPTTCYILAELGWSSEADQVKGGSHCVGVQFIDRWLKAIMVAALQNNRGGETMTCNDLLGRAGPRSCRDQLETFREQLENYPVGN